MRLTWEQWLARLSGVPTDGTGLEVSWSHSWPGPHWLAAVLLLATILIVVWVAVQETGASRRTRASLALLRAVLLALVVGMMYGWFLHPHRTERPELLLVIDASASMAVEDLGTGVRSGSRASGASVRRVDRVKSLLLEQQALLPLLRDRYRLRLLSVGEQTTELGRENEEIETAIRELSALQDESRLGDDLLEILEGQRGRSTAAILFFTDGATTDGIPLADAARYAAQKSIPLFLVGMGSDQPPRDVWLSDVLVEDTVFVDDVVMFEAKVSHEGLAGRSVRVRLREAEREGAVAEVSLQLSADEPLATVRLPYRARQVGERRFSVEVVPVPQETRTDNNRLERVVNVRDESIRVLYVQAYPNREFHYLKHFLSRSRERREERTPPAADAAAATAGPTRTFELSTVLQEADLDYAGQEETAIRVFPVDREALMAYDVLIFGDVNPAFLSPASLENVADFVKIRGGGLIVLAGPRYTPLAYVQTPLAELLPVRLEDAKAPAPEASLVDPFRVRPSPLGMQAPQLQLAPTAEASARQWENLPGLYWLLEAPRLKPAGRALLECPTRTGPAGEPLPVVSMQFVGAGKVVFHSTDETYRWSRSAGGEQAYERYWLQTLRYLCRSKLQRQDAGVALTTDRAEYRRGDSVLIRAEFLDEKLAPGGDLPVTAVVEQLPGLRRSISLPRSPFRRGVFEATVRDLPPGQYRVWLSAAEGSAAAAGQRFQITAAPAEQQRLAMDGGALRGAAKHSRGRFYLPEQAARIPWDLPRGRAVRTEPLPPVPIWNSPWLAALFVLLITSEWVLRKRAGLI